MKMETAKGGEKWKPIPNYENEYMVSDKGRVKSLPRTIIRSKDLSMAKKERI